LWCDLLQHETRLFSILRLCPRECGCWRVCRAWCLQSYIWTCLSTSWLLSSHSTHHACSCLTKNPTLEPECQHKAQGSAPGTKNDTITTWYNFATSLGMFSKPIVVLVVHVDMNTAYLSIHKGKFQRSLKKQNQSPQSGPDVNSEGSGPSFFYDFWTSPSFMNSNFDPLETIWPATSHNTQLSLRLACSILRVCRFSGPVVRDEQLRATRKQLALSTQLPRKNASGDSLTLFNANIIAFYHVRQSDKTWAELVKQNCFGKTLWPFEHEASLQSLKTLALETHEASEFHRISTCTNWSQDQPTSTQSILSLATRRSARSSMSSWVALVNGFPRRSKVLRRERLKSLESRLPWRWHFSTYKPLEGTTLLRMAYHCLLAEHV